MPLKLKAILAGVLFILIVSGAWFYLGQEQLAMQQAQAELIVSAHLKVDEITEWRARGLADASVLAESPFFIEGVQKWLADSQAVDAEPILTRFRSMQKYYHYNSLTLVNSVGKARLGLPAVQSEALPPGLVQAVADAIQQRHPILTDLHLEPGSHTPKIEFIAPLFAKQGSESIPIGAVILQNDVSEYLFPLIQSWPTSSQSAETLLIRRDGENVLYLNDLRFQQDAALKLRIPLSHTDVPAVMALLGHEGVVQGKDYRGVEVLAYLAAIPDSPWFIVAKIDNQEALSAWRSRSSLILILLLGLGAAAAAGIGLLWQRDAAARYQAMFQMEAAQRESEARYAITLMSIGDGVIATDETGRVEFMNPVAEALTGWKQEEARTRPLAEVFKIINEMTRQEVETPVERVLRDGVIVGLANHTLLISHSGREFPIADSGAPIRIGEDKASGVVLVFRDQSEERASALALQALSNRQRNLLAAIPDIIMEVDTNKVYRWANQSGIDFFGEDAIGKEAADFFEGEQNVYQTVQPLFFGNEDVIYVESWQRRKDGEKRLLAWWCRVLKDSNGAVTGALSSARDITGNRQIEESLHTSEEKYHSLFQNMIEGYAYCQMIFENDQPQDFIYVDVNPAFEILTGLKDVVGKKATQVIPGIKKDNPELFEIYGGVVMTGKPVGFEVYLSSLKIWLLISVFRPIPGHFVAVFENITERKLAEEALKAYSERLEEMVEKRTQELKLAQEKIIRQERLAILGQLAGGVGHELRNPLGVMANAVYYLKITLPNADAKIKQYFGILENEIHTSEKIINDLLDFSRVKSVDREKAALAPLITRLLERHKPSDKISVKLEIPNDLPPLYADPRQISQVLGNLVVNAYQAMPDGGELAISASSRDNKIFLQVQDSGIGISPESISKIFEPLFTTKARGIGLGLAVSKRLIEVNGGNITVKSELGKGSTFTVELPTFRGNL